MAFNAEARWYVSVSFEDNNGNIASTSFYLSGALSFADATDDATAIVNAMQGASNARARKFSFVREFINDDVSPLPAESEVERKLAVTMGNANFADTASIALPSPIFALEQPRTDQPDPTNAAWLALQTALLGSLVTPGTGITDYRGVPVTRITRAAVVHRSRKPRT